MKQIDLEPREHSRSYELKPENRWGLVLAIIFALAMALAAGFFLATTWAMFLSGALVATFAILCFPKTFLTKIPRR